MVTLEISKYLTKAPSLALVFNIDRRKPSGLAAVMKLGICLGLGNKT
jgi:hypothetical protein